MKKKSERKLKKEELRKKLADAIEEKLKRMDEYRKTPSRQHLEKIISELNVEDDAAIVIGVFNKEAQQFLFKGVKCRNSDIIALSQYMYVKAVQDDVAAAMDAVCTIARQEELNKCWSDAHDKEQEVKEEDDGQDQTSK